MTRTVVDDLGTRVVVSDRPRRIVSLVPNLSEVLWWWRLAEVIVGVTDYCVAPPRAFEAARRVRGTKNPDVRAIADLRPDLVVANEEENRELDVRRLREAGISVYVTRVRTVADAAATFPGLGAAVGEPTAGEALAASLLRAADTAGRRGPRLRVVCPIWRDGAHRGAEETWWVVGPDTYAADLLAVCGMDVRMGIEDSHDDVAVTRYPRVSLAQLRTADPDALLLPDEPYAFGPEDARVFADWRAATRLLDGTALTWWGPRTPTAIGDLDRLRRQLARPRGGPSRQ